MIAVGVASPSAHGQAMMSTATALRTAAPTSPPNSAHPAKTTMATRITAGTKTPDTRSASFWMGAFVAWASSTRRMIWLRAVLGPTNSTSTSSRPCWLTVAAKTRDPGSLSTGMLSPVSIDSSTFERPDVTVPSAGIFSPGSTTTVSPGASSSGSTRTSIPPRTTRACFAPSSASLAIASLALPLALASKYLPSRISVMIIAALSKKM